MKTTADRCKNGIDDEREQSRIRKRAAKAIGAIAGGDPLRAERAHQYMHEHLKNKAMVRRAP